MTMCSRDFDGGPANRVARLAATGEACRLAAKAEQGSYAAGVFVAPIEKNGSELVDMFASDTSRSAIGKGCSASQLAVTRKTADVNSMLSIRFFELFQDGRLNPAMGMK